MQPTNAGAVLVTGASGYLGNLVAAKLFVEEPGTLVLPVREPVSRDRVLGPLVAELEASGNAPGQTDLERLVVVPMPPAERVHELLPELRRHNVTRIAHCAGCVDYFDTEKLTEGNVVLTRELLELGRKLDVERFYFLSTAFSCGFVDGLVCEQLHGEPPSDPTEYTRTKRQAEALVAASDLPWIILRPSVVIGNSQDGRYAGKRYGLYQLWSAAERLLCAQYVPVIHAIAPDVRVQFVHQDAFQEGFHWACRHLPPGSIIHLVSNQDTLPTVRDIWDLWLETCARPQEIHYYRQLADVPRERLNRRQQLWVEFTAVNLDISTREWHFETAALQQLRSLGLQYVDATVETIGVCQDRFMNDSPRIQGFMEKFRAERSVTPRIFDGYTPEVAELVQPS